MAYGSKGGGGPTPPGANGAGDVSAGAGLVNGDAIGAGVVGYGDVNAGAGDVGSGVIGAENTGGGDV